MVRSSGRCGSVGNSCGRGSDDSRGDRGIGGHGGHSSDVSGDNSGYRGCGVVGDDCSGADGVVGGGEGYVTRWVV